MLSAEASTEAEGEAVQARFLEFLESYRENEQEFYYQKAQQLVISEKTTLNIDMHHLIDFEDLSTAIYSDFYKYETYIERAAQRYMFRLYPEYAKEHEVHIGFIGLPTIETIRDLKTSRIGKLLSVSGTVTKSTEVRPELRYGSFKCMACGYEVKDVGQQFKYTQPQVCPNGHCGNKFRWELMLESSKFCD